MASPAIKHTEIRRGEFSFTPNFRSLPELAASLGAVPAGGKRADGRGVLTAVGLKGAKSAMVAIGLEAAAALCVYGIWQAWHILR
jgi:uncharacterized protein YfaA (DUF2138 family)